MNDSNKKKIHHANTLKWKGQKNNQAEPGEESKKTGQVRREEQ